MSNTPSKTGVKTRTTAAVAVITVVATLAGGLIIQQLTQNFGEKSALVFSNSNTNSVNGNGNTNTNGSSNANTNASISTTNFDSEAFVLRSPNFGMGQSSFGSALAQVGDVNGDGYEDLFIGDFEDDSNNGAVFGYYGSVTGVVTTPDWTATGVEVGNFGFSVDGSGDMNGDGFDDLVIGESTSGVDASGKVYIYFGSTSGLTSSADITIEGYETEQHFGNDVASLGDMNGDGYDDVAVLTALANGSRGVGTRVSIYYGSATGPGTTEDWTFVDYSGQLDEQINNLDGIGDVNGDGYNDMALGTPTYSRAGAQIGLVSIFYGSTSGFAALPNVTLSGRQVDAYFGVNVSGVNDINGDGYDDVLVGAPAYTNGNNEEGSVVVYYGSTSGLTRRSSWIMESNVNDAWFGASASALSDADGDGYSDILIGAPYYLNSEDGTGVVYVLGGSSTGIQRAPLAMQEPSGANTARFSSVVTTGVSLSGTTAADIAVYVEEYDDGADIGPAVLVYNNVNL